MHCQDVETRLLEDVDTAHEEVLTAHLRECSSCGSLHADLVGLDRMVSGMRREVHAPAGFDLRVLERSRNWQARSLFWKSLAWSSLVVAILTLAGDRLFWTSPRTFPAARRSTPAEIHLPSDESVASR